MVLLGSINHSREKEKRGEGGEKEGRRRTEEGRGGGEG